MLKPILLLILTLSSLTVTYNSLKTLIDLTKKESKK